jgi:uncharacterized membrane protein
VGAGVGLATAGLQTTAIESVEASEAGSAAGVFATSRYAGSIVGTLVLAQLLSGGGGFRGVFAMVVAAAAGAAVAASLLPVHRRDRGAALAGEGRA